MALDAVRWLLELLLVGGALGLLAASTRSRPVLAITGLSFGLRLLIGQGMFLVSLFGLPIARGLQRPGGFWALAPDAAVFDAESRLASSMLIGHPMSGNVEHAV